jgi:RHS repeat-associated protein
LGSSSLITNLDGETVQHIEYVPFGEVFIEERNNTWNTPYLFNAKELDEETGLYYYGARYYDPRISLWLSTDPLQEKYPNVSAYAYCIQNPINIIDPDGKKLVYLIRTKDGTAIRLTYSKGNFFYNDGRIYSLSSGNYDKTAYTVLKQYRKILDSGDKVLINQLHQLEKSEKIHLMQEGKTGSKARKEGNKTRTFWDFSEKAKDRFEKIEGIPYSEFSTIAHEMRHQYDRNINNDTDNLEENTAKDPSEIRAVNLFGFNSPPLAAKNKNYSLKIPRPLAAG